MRFPPGRINSPVDVRIGVYGKGPGKWSLKEARDEWELIRTWSRENNRDSRDRKREQKKALVQRTTSPTFEQAFESYLSEWTSANNQGKRNTGISSGTRSCLSSEQRNLWSNFLGTTSIQEERQVGS